MDTSGGKQSVSRRWLRALEATADVEGAPHRTLPVRLADIAAERADAPALLGDDETLTFAALSARVAAIAAWAREKAMPPGICVGLNMANGADYVATWLGLSAAGVVVALLNTNLRGAALAHCARSAACTCFVADADGASALRAAGLEGESAIHAPRDLVAARPGSDAAAIHRPCLDDTALLIYTSGTTGLPKAARVSHRRLLTWCLWFAGLMDVTPQDRMYNCLPMYHSVGGVVAVGSMLVAGASVAIAPRFSARRFWCDIARFDCTIFQYIGELCRYLVNAPPTPQDRAHGLRLCCGNGLRADVWQAFAARFAVPQILEFYAATEGNFSLFNVEGRPGAIGRIPAFLAHRQPIALVAFDPAQDAPRRGPDGFCTRVARGDVGEAIGRVDRGGARFEGYTDTGATERKLLHDVFARGDVWLRTGDLMRQDAEGFFYFVDRIGDTFRWKGENVASAEVADVLSACPGVTEATVYGVAVPGAEGRAGMAALVVDAAFDVTRLARHLQAALPAYARPLFLRLQQYLPQTATFKPQKTALAAEGFDPTVVADPLYLFDGTSYVVLDAACHARIGDGCLRL